ncbi:peroxiredoxin-like family protein [Amycolatopsis mongoliensis]|uniref:thioredoxin-dependent peroxiredoxin n=1 Tax=Amycolatopsis mongoliensis TaxID=715475 RepID=A0A9Y2NGN9_9PSEU|nr:peroxiredoxin-like family protein [Amycolatopsis sp. 4-36]WIY01004.1 peroxiredoxin-like family protein [Amycolatopsis sp. 4-36]
MTVSLEEELQAQRTAAWSRRDARERVVRAAAVTRVAESGLAEGALGVGEPVPRFTLPDALGRPIAIGELLHRGPVVLSFYRGGWCPYCNLELRALEGVLAEITSLGAPLVAISPELPDSSLSTAEKNALTFPVLSDHGNLVARRFRIVHAIAPSVVAYQLRNGNDVAAYNGARSAEVPLPATYVIDADGRIRFASVDADYTRRAEPAEVLEALRSVVADAG